MPRTIEAAARSVLKTSTQFSGRIVIVTDASVLVAIFVDDGRLGKAARARLRNEDLAAPELADLEVTSALRGLLRAGKIDEHRRATALAELGRLPVRRAPHRKLLKRCWELRDALSVYDASYVALAEMLDATLVTTDVRLSRTPRVMCSIEVVSSG
jgi:predicted nucleic acid-binding protein